jgi:hypothetical protein
MLEEVRIEAKPEVVPKVNADVIVEHSADAALVFLPFRLTGSQIVDRLGEPLADMLSRLPVVAAVLAAQDIELDAEPEEGKAAEVAAALDALAEAEKNAKEAEEAAAEAASKADEALRGMRDAVLSGADEEALNEVERLAREAKAHAIKTARKAAKAIAEVETAARNAEALGAIPAQEAKEPGEPSDPKSADIER